MSAPLLLRRIALTLVGTALVLLGLALLALPGPGLLVLAVGLVLLSWEYPALRRWAHPLRVRAVRAAHQAAQSPLRFGAAVTCGVGMVAAGVAWAALDWLPLSSFWTGAGLACGGMALLASVAWARRTAPPLA